MTDTKTTTIDCRPTVAGQERMLEMFAVEVLNAAKTKERQRVANLLVSIVDLAFTRGANVTAAAAGEDNATDIITERRNIIEARLDTLLKEWV